MPFAHSLPFTADHSLPFTAGNTCNSQKNMVLSVYLRGKAVNCMIQVNGFLMSGDTVIATIQNNELTEQNEDLLPIYLKRTGNLEGWLASRAIDTHRTNSRLLKKVLRLKTSDDAETALAVNAATITDQYWVKPEGSELCWEDVRFKENFFDTLALRGDPDSFSRKPSRTPELTNTGSFEKCWRLINGAWWMYKNGNQLEYFSELFICRLGEKLGLDMAHYEMDDKYIRSMDFTHGAKVNFEPISALMGENEDYSDCYDAIFALSPALAEQYLRIVWLDTVCFNMDRHTENYGILRDVDTGEILFMAPNYDNNIALIARGYPASASRIGDGLIRFFREFLDQNPGARAMYQSMELPIITEQMIEECFAEIRIEIDRAFVKDFILNGQAIVHNLIF